MDSYKEQIVKVKPTFATYACKIMIWVLAVLIGFAGFYFALQMKFPFLILISAAIIYSAYKVNSMLNIEFEYIATNGSVDVDKIINKSSRKRLVSFECNKVEGVKKYSSDHQKNSGVKTFVCTDDMENAYVFTVSTKEFGKSEVILSPNENFINHIKLFIPRSLVSDWWK